MVLLVPAMVHGGAVYLTVPSAGMAWVHGYRYSNSTAVQVWQIPPAENKWMGQVNNVSMNHVVLVLTALQLLATLILYLAITVCTIMHTTRLALNEHPNIESIEMEQVQARNLGCDQFHDKNFTAPNQVGIHPT